MYFHTQRTLCDVLSEMRACQETLNFSSLLGLIEEAQGMGNRMESALAMKKDMIAMEEEHSAKKKELRDLQIKIKKAEAKLPGAKKAKKKRP